MTQTVSSISTANNFQYWLDRTNDLISIVNNNALTASPTGDYTTGNATLFGVFTANTLVGSVKTDYLSSNTSGNTIAVSSPVSIAAASQTGLTLTNTAGSRVNFSTGSTTWTVGFYDNITNNFMINTGSGAPVFEFISTGELQLKDVVATGNVVATTLSGDGHLITSINANNILTGTLADARLPSTVVKNNADQNITGSIYAKAFYDIDNIAYYLDAANTTISLKTAGDATFNGGIGVGTNATIAGRALVSGGSALSPSIAFIPDSGQNTGLYWGGEGNISFSVNGVYAGQFASDKSFTAANTITSSTGVVATTGMWSPIFYDRDNPAYYLDPANIGTSLNIAGSIVGAGSITMAGNITAYSDARLKTNVATIENALSTVCSLRGVTYVKDGAKGIGVIAQEVEAVVPELVAQGEYKSVAYGNMVGLLIEAVKELKNENELLRAEINAIKGA